MPYYKNIPQPRIATQTVISTIYNLSWYTVYDYKQKELSLTGLLDP
jgi:hypothetical protein